MLRRTLSTLVGLVILAGFPARADQPAWDPRLVTGTLGNGLTYILHDSGKAEDPFNIRLIVHAGSVDEPKPSGIAHILEHMVFQSNRAHPQSMHHYFQQIGWRTGVQINAMTRETETQYMVRTRPDDALDLEGSLRLASDLAFGAELKAEDWEKERFVILEELRQGNSLADRVSRQKKAILRVGSRFADRPTIGTREGIEATTIDEIRAFYEQFYVASNMTLIVSGRIETMKAKAVIEETFGKAPSKPAPDRSYVPLPLKEGLEVGLVQEPRGSSSQVTYAFRLPMPERRSDAGQFAYLQKYFLTRLIRDAVQAQAPHHAKTVDSLTAVMQEPTEERLILAFNARTENHDAARAILLEAVERLRREGLSREGFDDEMARARRINENNIEASSFRTFAEWEDRIASAVLTGSVVDDPLRRAERTTALLDRITLEGLNARLRTMLSTSDQVLFYQVPGGREVTLPSSASVIAERDRLRALPALPPLPAAVAAPAPVAEAPIPAWPSDAGVAETGQLVSEHHDGKTATTEWVLGNGDRVVWLERKTPDGKVYLSAQSAPGYLNREFGSIASQAALQLWPQSGYGFWSQDEYDRWTATQKTRWNWSVQDGLLDIATVSAAEQLPEMLKQYAAAITYGTIREEGAQAFRDQMATAGASGGEISALLYGDTADRRDHRAADLTASDLQHIARMHLGQPVTWFVVGQKPTDAIRTAFTRIIGAIERHDRLTATPLLQQDGRRETAIASYDDNRARVELTFFTPMNWTPEAGFIISALTPMAQQALKNELRNRLGGIYSLEMETRLDPDTNRAISTLAFYCAPERTEELKHAAIRVLADMDETVGQADIGRLRQDIIFAESARLDDPNTWLRRLALSYRRYGDAGYLERMGGLAERITAPRLIAHARHVFRTDNLVAVIKGPKNPQNAE